MRLHELGPARGARKDRRRVARGNAGSGGTYAGRGRKGQNARSGGSKGPYFEGGQLPFVRRLPHRRGFKNIFRVDYLGVDIATLEARFEAGATVDPTSLTAVGILSEASEPYKILGNAGLSKALTVHAPRFSQAARQAIGDAGGSCVGLEDAYTLAGMRRAFRPTSPG